MDINFKEVLGRYAVASRNFKPGDEIFSEVPFAFGPKADSRIVCLGCYKPVDGIVGCTVCGWPVCGKRCELILAHKNAECKVFAKSKVPFYKTVNPERTCLQYECITPLRVLIAKESNPKRWKEEVEVMEAHNKRRKYTSIWQFNQINIVNYLRGPCKLDNVFEEDLIHTVCGILESNAFEARTVSDNLIRCLYPKLGILSHNCISNINHSIWSMEPEKCDFKVKVKAATNIHQGEELFSSYTYSLWPTPIRIEFLKQSKYFSCCCSRCNDPTELGTHMSTLKCQACSDGLVMSTNPLDNTAKWKCTNCNQEIADDLIKQLFTDIQEDLDNSSNLEAAEFIKHLEQALLKYKSVLHSQHAFICAIKSTLIQLYKQSSFSDKIVVYCRELLKVLDIIEPGYSRIRATTLFELSMALTQLITTKNNSARRYLEEITNLLTECSKILDDEAPLTLEGRTGKRAKFYLINIQKFHNEIADGTMPINRLLSD